MKLPASYLNEAKAMVGMCAAVGSSIDKFQMKHGMECKMGPLPKGVRLGRMGNCYNTAFKLALRNRRFLYCEGHANSHDQRIPLPHAWCVTVDGEFFDPTWPNGKDYFGLVFSRDYTIQAAVTIREFPVLYLIPNHRHREKRKPLWELTKDELNKALVKSFGNINV